MSRQGLIAVLALWAFACAETGSRPAVTPTAPTITLSIVGTNDLHGAILQRGDRGGLSLLGGYVANVRAARPRRRRGGAPRCRRYVPGNAGVEPQRGCFGHRRLQHPPLYGGGGRQSRLRLRPGGATGDAAGGGR